MICAQAYFAAMKATNINANDLMNIVKAEFARRANNNPNYSLRSFARQLGISHSHLSRLMSKNRKPTQKTTAILLENLRLSEAEIDHKLKSLGVTYSRLDKYQKLLESQFSLISNWYHFAILELALLEDFNSDPKWIAQRLNISKSEVNIALERLQQEGHLIIESDGSWKVQSVHTTWSNTKTTSEARKMHQKQVLTKAKDAINEVSYDFRQNSSLMLAADRTLLPEIKKRIQEFKDSISEFIEAQGKYNEVYQLSLAFFPLTRSEILTNRSKK
jgi:transcriptional regulator with XRE-family HTH domain